MVIEENHVFNLWDTNGRRADIVNAIDIYLSFLSEENNKKDFLWSNFPSSLIQYRFYKNAIFSSPDVFSEHPKFDYFDKKYSKEIEEYNNGFKTNLLKRISTEDIVLLDKDIEARARHYSSNLCKLGLITSNRKITPAGKTFLGDNFKKDEIESLLPLNNTNIVILRQLLKLRIYSKPLNGTRNYYSPFYAALYLLLQNKTIIDEDMFKTIVQSMNPYSLKDIDEVINNYKQKNGDIIEFKINIPSEYIQNTKINFDTFKKEIKNTKSSSVVKYYYDFYSTLYDFNKSGDECDLEKCLNLFSDRRTRDILKKAFGYGQNIFCDIESFYSYGKDTFINNNANSDLLSSNDFNKNFYIRFFKSKYFDSAREYFDTTKRILSASGLFRFDKAQPILSYKDILKSVFKLDTIKCKIFGTTTESDYQKYEGCDKVDCTFSSSDSLVGILNIGNNELNKGISEIESEYGVQRNKIFKKVKEKTNSDFLEHINSKYTKDVVLTIMRLFSDRSNDHLIKQMVNPEASVPTIYEFITAIAWYYLSEKQMDLFDSLNLTLNSEFEPILHAGGGDGDIIANYDNIIVMLEVTLMDKNSQKRGELEPVLRHSTNLRAKYSNIDTMTFFIADELDQSTVITWRVSALAPREAANSTMVDNVRIMAFTNEEICAFIQNGITSTKIIDETKNVFINNDFQNGWRERAVARIMA